MTRGVSLASPCPPLDGGERAESSFSESMWSPGGVCCCSSCSLLIDTRGGLTVAALGVFVASLAEVAAADGMDVVDTVTEHEHIHIPNRAHIIFDECKQYL